MLGPAIGIVEFEFATCMATTSGQGVADEHRSLVPTILLADIPSPESLGAAFFLPLAFTEVLAPVVLAGEVTMSVITNDGSSDFSPGNPSDDIAALHSSGYSASSSLLFRSTWWNRKALMPSVFCRSRR